MAKPTKEEVLAILREYAEEVADYCEDEMHTLLQSIDEELDYRRNPRTGTCNYGGCPAGLSMEETNHFVDMLCKPSVMLSGLVPGPRSLADTVDRLGLGSRVFRNKAPNYLVQATAADELHRQQLKAYRHIFPFAEIARDMVYFDIEGGWPIAGHMRQKVRDFTALEENVMDMYPSGPAVVPDYISTPPWPRTQLSKKIGRVADSMLLLLKRASIDVNSDRVEIVKGRKSGASDDKYRYYLGMPPEDE